MSINLVADLSHYNNAVDLRKAKNSGLVGIFHKATQGLSFKDPLYEKHRAVAQSEGLLWGSYHFGDGSDGVAQAEFFLKTVGDPKGQLLVLDFEANTAGPSMSIVEAHAFITHVRNATGVWPGFYCGHYYKELLRSAVDPILSQCWLWLAQYGPTAVLPPTWKEWTFWQYTDGACGPEPRSAEGIGFCDRDQFNGTEAELRSFWQAECGAAELARASNQDHLVLT